MTKERRNQAQNAPARALRGMTGAARRVTDGQDKVSVRRVFHGIEARYLSPEARFLAASLMDSQSVPHETTEKALQQALMLGLASDSSIDEETFETIVEAIALDPSFRVPVLFFPFLPPTGNWVC